eukprot:5966104-Pyramimonas_sp.AAC.1
MSLPLAVVEGALVLCDYIHGGVLAGRGASSATHIMIISSSLVTVADCVFQTKFVCGSNTLEKRWYRWTWTESCTGGEQPMQRAGD